MALVVKSNQTRNAIMIVVLAAAVLGGSLYLFRGTLFPPAAPTAGPGTAGAPVDVLPVYSESGLEALNTNTARSLTPHGAANVNPCPGRDNPFEPIEGSVAGCP